MAIVIISIISISYFNLYFHQYKEKKVFNKTAKFIKYQQKKLYFKEHPIPAVAQFFNKSIKNLNISSDNIIIQNINLKIDPPVNYQKGLKLINLNYAKYNVLISKDIDFNLIRNIVKNEFKKYVIPSNLNIRYFIYSVKNNCFCIFFYYKRVLFLKGIFVVKGENKSGFDSIKQYVKAPKIAIDIDDIGYDSSLVEKLTSLKIPITFAIFPDAPFSKEIDLNLHKLGYETIMHTPMQSIYRSLNPGPGALFVPMDKKVIKKIIEKDLLNLPYVDGANNHEGSLFTSEKNKICYAVKIFKEKRMFFMDSLTDANSFAYRCALKQGLPSAQRDIFLDDEPSLKYITNQLKIAKDFARRFKRVIAIGHPRPLTVQVLLKQLPEIKKDGYKFVPLCEFLR